MEKKRGERLLIAAALLIAAGLILYEGFSGRPIEPAVLPVASQSQQADDSARDSEEAIVNLNTADQEQLLSLPGIGEAKAAAILDYRAENGPFLSVEELTLVKGIGEKTLESLRGRLTV